MKKILGSPIDTIEDLPEEEEEIIINRKEHFSGDAWFLNPAAVANKATMNISGTLGTISFFFLTFLIAVFYFFTAVFSLAVSGYMLFEFLPGKIRSMYKSFREVKED